MRILARLCATTLHSWFKSKWNKKCAHDERWKKNAHMELPTRKREINNSKHRIRAREKKRRDHMNLNGFIYKTKTTIKVLHYLTYSITVFFYSVSVGADFFAVVRVENCLNEIISLIGCAIQLGCIYAHLIIKCINSFVWCDCVGDDDDKSATFFSLLYLRIHKACDAVYTHHKFQIGRAVVSICSVVVDAFFYALQR